MKKFYLLLFIFGVMILLIFKTCYHDGRGTKNLDSSKYFGAFPLKVMPIRDGRTTLIRINDFSGNILRDVFFVYDKQGSEFGGKIYAEADWQNSKPLSQNDAENVLNQVVTALENYYGKEQLRKISNDKKMIDNMTDKEMSHYMKNPMSNNRLDAAYALDLVTEFRKFIKVSDKVKIE
jgi:hypothetical protein